MDLKPNHAERRVYHRCRASYIIRTKARVYLAFCEYIIIAKEDTACG